MSTALRASRRMSRDLDTPPPVGVGWTGEEEILPSVFHHIQVDQNEEAKIFK